MLPPHRRLRVPCRQGGPCFPGDPGDHLVWQAAASNGSIKELRAAGLKTGLGRGTDKGSRHLSSFLYASGGRFSGSRITWNFLSAAAAPGRRRASRGNATAYSTCARHKGRSFYAPMSLRHGVTVRATPAEYSPKNAMNFSFNDIFELARVVPKPPPCGSSWRMARK